MTEKAEKAICVGLCTGSTKDEQEQAERSLEELAELAEAAGASVEAIVLQNRKHPEPATYMGSGKLQEIKQMSQHKDINLIICDDELSGSQMRNIEQETDCRVIDRSMLILDIFARRAVTREGKIQVEMAQLQYQLSHLAGQGQAMSRLAGGIGTRGPGESQMETDRRHIYRKIASLQKALTKVSLNREQLRRKRQHEANTVIAVVGYTNAGKSTLINRICQSDLFTADQVFATLDPSVRRLQFSDQRDVLLVDTIGFIRKLPHHLIDAFHSTLEEVRQADAILQVVDASDPDLEQQMETVDQLLADLEASSKRRIIIFNKIDQLDLPQKKLFQNMARNKGRPDEEMITLSAKTGEGLDKLIEKIRQFNVSRQVSVSLLIPYQKTSWLHYMRQHGSLDSVAYLNEGIRAAGHIPQQFYEPLRPFVRLAKNGQER